MHVTIDVDARSVCVYPFPVSLCRCGGLGRTHSSRYRTGEVNEAGQLAVRPAPSLVNGQRQNDGNRPLELRVDA